ncbi:hypothetical protein PRIPAC_80114, partial [Pristionchus pacificus]|uniref:Uncharacterized protein n=1 Tax=Pristionchus pacificus TaxID=54126 RepID=A0A2A6BHZ9_PRIPA
MVFCFPSIFSRPTKRKCRVTRNNELETRNEGNANDNEELEIVCKSTISSKFMSFALSKGRKEMIIICLRSIGDARYKLTMNVSSIDNTELQASHSTDRLVVRIGKIDAQGCLVQCIMDLNTTLASHGTTMWGRSHPKYGPAGDRRQSIALVPKGSQNRAAKRDLIGE